MRFYKTTIFGKPVDQPDDIAYFKLAKNGDVKAFEYLFKKYYSKLCHYAHQFVNDLDESEEIVQQVFVNVWQNLATITIETSVQSYLYRAVNNYTLNMVKQKKNRHRIASDLSYHEEKSHTDTTDNLLKEELSFRINAAIELLPEQCRLIFQLNRFEGLKYQEIANQLGLSIKTVENQIGKALKLMREELRDYLPILLLLLPHLFI